MNAFCAKKRNLTPKNRVGPKGIWMHLGKQYFLIFENKICKATYPLGTLVKIAIH